MRGSSAPWLVICVRRFDVQESKFAACRNHDSNSTRRFAWQDGYWAESLGPADLDLIARYVRRQRDHHYASHPAERWASAVESR
jgi:hypothetical protein